MRFINYKLVIYLFNNINNLSCKGIQLVLKNNPSRETLFEHKFSKYFQFFFRTTTNSRNRVQAIHKSNIDATYESYRSIKFWRNEISNVKRIGEKWSKIIFIGYKFYRSSSPISDKIRQNWRESNVKRKIYIYKKVSENIQFFPLKSLEGTYEYLRFNRAACTKTSKAHGQREGCAFSRNTNAVAVVASKQRGLFLPFALCPLPSPPSPLEIGTDRRITRLKVLGKESWCANHPSPLPATTFIKLARPPFTRRVVNEVQTKVFLKRAV